MQLPVNDSTFWLAYWASNAAGSVLAVTGWRFPRIARYLFAGLFGWACWFNLSTVAATPEIYVDYAWLTPVSFYAEFLTGWFADHIAPVVTSIAVGQGLVAVGMLIGGRYTRIAAIMAMCFLIGVAPLGLGSAFPASLLMAAGAFFVFRNAAPTD